MSAAQSTYALPSAASEDPPSDGGGDGPRTFERGVPVSVLDAAGSFPCLSRCVAFSMGLDVVGVPMSFRRRCLHVFGSLFCYTWMASVIWLFFGPVFGYPQPVANGCALAVLVSFSLLVCPSEQWTWGDPMKIQYLQDKRENLMTKNHTADAVTQGLFTFFMMYLPLTFIFIPVLFDSDKAHTFDAAVVAVTWFCFVGGIVNVAIFAGWGPLHAVLVQDYNKYITEELVIDFADRVIAVLVDGETPADLRREKLGRLQERRGSNIRDTLQQYLNVQILLQFPFMAVWLAVYLLLLVPDLCGGLPRRGEAVIQDAWLRVTIGIAGLHYMGYSMGYGLTRAMAKPHALFEERICREIVPHLPKLHTAMQLFPSGSTHETLLVWIRGQGIAMKIFGVQVDSTLPGKFASVIISLAGAAAYGLARSYSQSASGGSSAPQASPFNRTTYDS